jgi:hypothetical protein
LNERILGGNESGLGEGKWAWKLGEWKFGGNEQWAKKWRRGNEFGGSTEMPK